MNNNEDNQSVPLNLNEVNKNNKELSINPNETINVAMAKSSNKKAVLKILGRVFFILLSLGLLMLYLFKKEDPKDIKETIMGLNTKYLVLAFVLQFCVYIYEAAVIYFMKNKYLKHTSFLNQLNTAVFGALISATTPIVLSLNIIAHIAHMVTEGLSAARASSIMFLKTVVYQISLMIAWTIIILLRFPFFSQKANWVMWAIIVYSYVVSILTAFGALFGPRYSKQIKWICVPIIRFLGKIHLIRKPDKRIEKLDTSLHNLKENMTNAIYTKFDYFLIVVMQLVGLAITYSVIYALYMAFNFENAALNINPITVVCAFAFCSIISSCIPIPGGIGITDVAFATLFIPLVGDDNISVFLVFWRLVTYYFPILIGLIALCFIKKEEHREHKKSISY